MPKKHPIIAAIEERISDREMHIDTVRRDILSLQEQEASLVTAQEQDKYLLQCAAPKKPRTKKEVAKDGANTGD